MLMHMLRRFLLHLARLALQQNIVTDDNKINASIQSFVEKRSILTLGAHEIRAKCGFTLRIEKNKLCPASLDDRYRIKSHHAARLCRISIHKQAPAKLPLVDVVMEK